MHEVEVLGSPDAQRCDLCHLCKGNGDREILSELANLAENRMAFIGLHANPSNVVSEQRVPPISQPHDTVGLIKRLITKEVYLLVRCQDQAPLPCCSSLLEGGRHAAITVKNQAK